MRETPNNVQDSRLKWNGHVMRREDDYIGGGWYKGF